MSLAVGWAICLLIAFIIYPKPDNLVTGYLAYLTFGEDGLGRLSGLTALAISVFQVLFMYCVGYVLGRRIWQKRKRNGHE